MIKSEELAWSFRLFSEQGSSREWKRWRFGRRATGLQNGRAGCCLFASLFVTKVA